MSVGVVRVRGVDRPGKLLCDGGVLAPVDCRITDIYAGGRRIPDGWEARLDPFGRVDEAGDPRVLHLCDRCLAHVPVEHPLYTVAPVGDDGADFDEAIGDVVR